LNYKIIFIIKKYNIIDTKIIIDTIQKKIIILKIQYKNNNNNNNNIKNTIQNTVIMDTKNTIQNTIKT
jgi:hypothetical protein